MTLQGVPVPPTCPSPPPLGRARDVPASCLSHCCPSKNDLSEQEGWSPGPLGLALTAFGHLTQVASSPTAPASLPPGRGCGSHHWAVVRAILPTCHSLPLESHLIRRWLGTWLLTRRYPCIRDQCSAPFSPPRSPAPIPAGPVPRGSSFLSPAAGRLPLSHSHPLLGLCSQGCLICLNRL